MIEQEIIESLWESLHQTFCVSSTRESCYSEITLISIRSLSDLSAADDWTRDDKESQHLITITVLRSSQTIDRVLHTWWETDATNIKIIENYRIIMKRVK